MPILSIDDALLLTKNALERNNTSANNAQSVADALVQAQIEQQFGHGLSRLLTYAPQAMNGKVNGHAIPTAQSVTDAIHRVDAAHGFAFPALDLAADIVQSSIGKTGICLVGIQRSHHFGQASRICEQLANKGIITLLFGNTPKAMPIPPAKVPILGTNPIAFAAPSNNGPVIIDMALSHVARGKIVVAQQKNEKIPLDWATDSNGVPTDQPEKALEGMLQPAGGTKGAVLALLVEIMAAAFTNSSFGFESSSLLNSEGEPPNLGQCLIAIDANSISPYFYQRMDTLLTLLTQHDIHTPGSRKKEFHRAAKEQGLNINAPLLQKIAQL